MKDDTNPGVEFFYKLSSNPDFQKDIAEARKNLGIPASGYRDPKTREKLWIEFKNANVLELLGEEMHIKDKYNIPTPYFSFIDDYIFFGKPMNASKIKSPVALLSPVKELDELYETLHEPTAKMLIFKNATQEKVIEFIKKNWRDIELTLNKNIHKARRVRKTLFKDKHRIIRELWRRPLTELQREVMIATKNKDMLPPKERDLLVARILVIRGVTSHEHSGGYIRKIANQKR